MENLELGIDFGVNGPEVKQQLDAVRSEIADTAKSAEAANEKVASSLKRVSEANNRVGQTGAFSRLQQAAKETTSELANTVASANSLKSLLAGGLSVFSAQQLITKIVQVRGEFQQLEIAFTTMLQSKEKANKLMGQITDLAAKTPFGLQEAAGAAKNLMAYGIAAEDVVSTIRTLGDVASGVSAPLGDITYLYGTLKASGHVALMDIRQFAGRGIPIYEELAKVMHTNVDEINGLVSAGKIGFPQIEQAFKNMAGAGGKFNNLMEAQSRSLTGLVSNLGDSVDSMFNELGKANEGILASSIKGISYLVENYEAVGNVLGLLISTYGSYRAALALCAVMQTSATASEAAGNAVRVTATALTEAQTAAQLENNAAVLANPYVIAAAALGGLVYILYKASNASTALTDAVGDAAMETAHERAELDELYGSLTQAAEGTKLRKELIEKFNSKYGNYLNQMLTEHSTALQIKKAYDQVNESLKTNIYLKTREKIQEKITKESVEGVVDYTSKAVQSIRLQKGAAAAGKSIVDLPKVINAVAYQINRSYEEEQKGNYKQRDLHSDEADKIVQKWVKDNKLKEGWGNQVFRTVSDYIYKAAQSQSTGNIQSAQADVLLGALKKELNTTTAPPAANKGRTLEAIDADIQAAKDNQKGAKTRKEFLAEETKINKLMKERAAIAGESTKAIHAQAAAENKLATAQKNVLEWLNQKEKDNAAKKLPRDQADAAKLAIEYDKKAAQAKAAGLGAGVLKRIDNAKKEAVGFDDYERATTKLSEELERQKQLFADFEEAKRLLGAEKAKQLFRNRIDTDKNYIQFLTAEQEKLSGKALNSLEGARFEMIGKLLFNANSELAKRSQDELIQAYKAAETFDDKIRRINEQYDKSREVIQKNATAEEVAGKLAVNEQFRNDELNGVKELQLQKLGLYRRLNEQVILMTRDQLKEQLKAVAILAAQNKNPVIAGQLNKLQSDLRQNMKLGSRQANIRNLEAQKYDIIGQLDDRNKLNISGPENDRAVSDLLKQLGGIQIQIDQINAKGLKGFLKNLKDNKALNDVAQGLGLASEAAGMLSQAFGGVDTEAGYTLDTISQLAGAAADMAGAIVSGDPVKMVSAGIKAIGTLFALDKKAKESNAKARKEVTDYYENAIAGERSYQAALMERELAVVRANKATINGIQAEIALREKQIRLNKQDTDDVMGKLARMNYITGETMGKHATWFRKAEINKTYETLAGKSVEELLKLLDQGKLEGDAKTLVEKLKELEQKGYDTKKALEDAKNEAKELLTGTSLGGMTDSLIDMFKSGKTGAKDLAEYFEEQMKAAQVESFKRNVMERALESYFDTFKELNADGLTGEERAQLRDMYTQITTGLNEQFKELQQVTGMDLQNTGKDSDAGTLKGAYKSASQESIDLLSANTGGLRLAVVEGNSYLKGVALNSGEQLEQLKLSVFSLINIEVNTRNTAQQVSEYLPLLKDIARNTRGNNNDLKAAGL